MQLDISVEPDNEEITIVLDNTDVLKASVGSKNELVMNQALQDLEDENEELYLVVRKILRELFRFSGV